MLNSKYTGSFQSNHAIVRLPVRKVLFLLHIVVQNEMEDKSYIMNFRWGTKCVYRGLPEGPHKDKNDYLGR